MQYTEEQKAAFKQRFAEIRRKQIQLSVPLVGLLLFVTVFRDGGAALPAPPEIVAGGGYVLLLGALVLAYRNWRCPACRGNLGRGMSPKFCAKCGVELS